MHTFFPFLLFPFFLFTALRADNWKGNEYAKNSESQKSSAVDFLQDIQLKGNETILDVGCGDGKITSSMAAKINQGFAIGLDISPSMIEHAKKNFADVQNLQFEVGDAAAISYKEKFDLITSFTVMQWVLKQEQALRAFHQALKPEGQILIQMPTGLPDAMKEAVNKTINDEKWKSYFVGFNPPWRFYGKEEYRALLDKTGFVQNHLGLVTKHEKFPSRLAFQGFIRQWFPYLRPLPENLKDAFITDLVDHYMKLLPADNEGRVSFIVERLQVISKKI